MKDLIVLYLKERIQELDANYLDSSEAIKDELEDFLDRLENLKL